MKNYGDITKVNAAELPDFDCLVGGFPCQAFSIAGKRRGFEDTRGTLFFDLARILRAKQPRYFVFENVKGLLSHKNGDTLRTIIATIDELGYDCQWSVLNSKDFGVPQNRERIVIVGHLRGTPRPEVFPICRPAEQAAERPPVELPVQLTEARTEEAKRIRRESMREGRDFSPRRGKILVPRKDNFANTVTATQGMERYVLDKEHRIRRLTPLECERLQGFPDNWTRVDDVSDSQRYKMAGNAVTTGVVRAVIERLVLTDAEERERAS